MFSQLTRYASELDVQIDDAEMDIRTYYDTTGKLGISDESTACRQVAYVWKIESPAPSQKVLEVLERIEKGCHTTNSMKVAVPVSGTLEYDGEIFEIRDG